MTTTTTFNTLHHYEKMIDAGFTEKQAKAQTDSIAELVDEKLATKKDLKDVELALKQDIAVLYKHINTFGFLLCGLIVVGVSLLGILMAHYG